MLPNTTSSITSSSQEPVPQPLSDTSLSSHSGTLGDRIITNTLAPSSPHQQSKHSDSNSGFFSSSNAIKNPEETTCSFNETIKISPPLKRQRREENLDIGLFSLEELEHDQPLKEGSFEEENDLLSMPLPSSSSDNYSVPTTSSPTSEQANKVIAEVFSKLTTRYQSDEIALRILTALNAQIKNGFPLSHQEAMSIALRESPNQQNIVSQIHAFKVVVSFFQALFLSHTSNQSDLLSVEALHDHDVAEACNNGLSVQDAVLQAILQAGQRSFYKEFQPGIDTSAAADNRAFRAMERAIHYFQNNPNIASFSLPPLDESLLTIMKEQPIKYS